MGTEVTLTAWDADLPEADVRAAVVEALERMEALESVLSRHREASALSALNRRAGQGPLEVPESLWRVLMSAKEAWERSGGAFDPTVGPLVRLWIGAAKANRMPADETIRSALANVGFDRVKWGPARKQVGLPAGFSLDLGGIAKGWIVDEAVRVLREKGIENGLVEAGGDLFALGKRADGSPWRVGVQDPAAGEGPSPALVRVLGVSGVGVTTSGHYRRFSTIEGRRVSHILDPKTGRPVSEAVASVTVVAPDSATADGLSTAVAVLGLEKGLALVESTDGAEALVLVSEEGGGYAFHETGGFSKYLAE
jgi:thiamine biosynthesis lipoprotein